MSDELDNLTEREMLIKLLVKFDAHAASNQKDHDVFGKRLDSHSGELKTLIAWRSWLGGATAVLGAVVGWDKLKLILK